MNIDFSFIAEAVGHVALAWALIRLTPTFTAFTLLMTGTLKKEDLKDYKEFTKWEGKKKW